MKIGIANEGVELDPSHASSSKLPACLPTDQPIFLIGMRGAGKTYVGSLAAEILGRRFVDADDNFASHTKMSVSDFVAAQGWPAFRQTEVVLLQSLMQKQDGQSIIALGGGVVESEAARTLLSEHTKKGGIVLHITRDMTDIDRYLTGIGTTAPRPAWGEDFADVYKRRKPWFRECSNYEFYNVLEPLDGQSKEDHHRATRMECARFFRFILGVDTNRPVLGRNSPTSFLSLTFPDVKATLSLMTELTEGTDAVELRVDLLSPSGSSPTSAILPPTTYVAQQLSMLRLFTSLPIVYSVRSRDQGGFAPSDNPGLYLEMVQLGIRYGCEYVDLEMAWPGSLLSKVVAGKGNSHIIASWHDWSGKMSWSSPEVKQKFTECAEFGEVVKIVGSATQLEDNIRLSSFASSIAATADSKPLLAINMGAVGQMSRILNPILTPITHELLPMRAAPGQLTMKQIQFARSLMGMTTPKRFYICGSPISHSMSPTMHNAAFQAVGLPHVYSRLEAAEVEQVVLDAIKAPDFGGMSVTMPMKLKIKPHLDSLSEDVEVLGAVNTIIPSVRDGKRHLHGENTDWKAIFEAAETNLDPSALSAQNGDLVGLVIGAGGTCRAALYALHKLRPAVIYLYNRTGANAEAVKASFPSDYNITILTSLTHLPQPPQLVISTVPGESLSTTKDHGIYIDPEVVLAASRGVAIDLAYKPAKTALMELAKRRQGWKAVPGIEILCLQGFVQHRLWIGREAAKSKIREAVMDQYLAGQ